MRNQHPGTCYRCGLAVAVGDGHFERITKRQRKAWGDLIVKGVNWLTQHSTCAIEFRGTDTHFMLSPEELDDNGKRKVGPRRVICPYCGEECEAMTGAEVWPHLPKLAANRLYVCRPCDARVGVHEGTWIPKGSPANAALRRARMAAHAVFDPMVVKKQRRDACSRNHARAAAYAWLARQLAIDPKDCHIAMMGLADCQRVIFVCQAASQKVAA